MKQGDFMNRRESYIDALKGWAILGTIMVHCGLWESSKASLLAASGARLCQLFLIISAYLLFGSYDRYCENITAENKTKNVMYWILKRFIRLIPLWYLSIFVSLLSRGESTFWLGTQVHVTWQNILSHVFFLHGLFPYYIDSILGVDWYIGDLSLLILLVPLIHRLIKTPVSALAWCFGTMMLMPYVSSHLNGLYLLPEADAAIWDAFINNWGFWNQLPVVLTGVLLYLIMQNDTGFERGTSSRQLSYILFAISVLLQYGLIFKGIHVWNLSIYSLFAIPYGILFLSQWLYSNKLVNNLKFPGINSSYSKEGCLL
ncbi:MAG: acyltransferase family protein [Bulleidia sp.]|nr:acyltransferase family protein [Bulleidia sp.]